MRAARMEVEAEEMSWSESRLSGTCWWFEYKMGGKRVVQGEHLCSTWIIKTWDRSRCGEKTPGALCRQVKAGDAIAFLRGGVG